jgi:hypothetical protein
MTTLRFSLISFIFIALLGTAHAGNGNKGTHPFDTRPQYNDFWEEPVEWVEADAVFPAFPVDANLMPVYVSAVQTNQYLIDPLSLSIGADGVVRYSLVVLTPGGARNVSYEGIRCSTGEWKTYATGHKTSESGTWTKARISAWRIIETKPVNRHHMAISKEYFCPFDNPVRSVEEAREALTKGGNPDVPLNQRK